MAGKKLKLCGDPKLAKKCRAAIERTKASGARPTHSDWPGIVIMLEFCPRCDYDLTGLPADHACPECGLRYDRASRIYLHATGITPFQGGVGVIGAIWIVLHSIRFLGTLAPGTRVLVAVPALAVIALITWSLWRRYGDPRRKRFVAILPDFLLIRLAAGRPRMFPWSNLSRVTPNRGLLGVTAFIIESKSVETIAGVFRSKVEAQDFADRCTARIRNELMRPVGEEPPVPLIPNLPDAAATAMDLKIYRQTPHPWFALPVILAGALVIITLPVTRAVRSLLAIGAIVAGVAAEIILIIRAPRLPQRVTLDRQGVTFTRGDVTVLAVPWTEISEVTLSRWNNMFGLQSEGGLYLFQCPWRTLGRFQAVANLRDEILRLKEHYSQTGNETAAAQANQGKLTPSDPGFLTG